MVHKTVLAGACLLLVGAGGGSVDAKESKAHARAMEGIAQDIAALKGDFPQLADFSPQKHGNVDRLSIEYAFRTHTPRHSGGWTAAVPSPDDDGLWFYIDLHDPASTAQIHTQPMEPSRCLNGWRVSFLILEGGATKSVRSSLAAILEKHGVKFCEEKERP